MNTIINKVLMFSRVLEGFTHLKTRYFQVNLVINSLSIGYSISCLIINIMYALKRLFLQAFCIIYNTQTPIFIGFQGLRSETPYFATTLNYCRKSLHNSFLMTK